MTPEAQRIAIAEACGWTCCGQVTGQPPHGLRPDRKVSDYTTQQLLNGDVPIETLPDYLNDLNAMHEAEKVLTTDRWFHYNCLLFRSLVPHDDGDEWDASSARHVVHATAAQKAEAFLRTLGKWSTQPTKGASRE